jgi:sugar O-acyltransferase (sialic acid O-acetyltransferase NeuD family)
MLKKLLLFPFGGNAKEILTSIIALNKIKPEFDIMGFIDDNPKTWGQSCCGVQVLGGSEILNKYNDALVLAVPGSPNQYLKRKEIIRSLNCPVDRFATVIDNSAHISPDAKIGYNTAIMQNVVISCEVEIGNHCIILPNTVIAHNGVIKDYCCIGSNVTLSGYVQIQENCYIGSGSKIRDNVEVGNNSLIGLGANVIKTVGSNLVMAGNPAKILRKIDL